MELEKEITISKSFYEVILNNSFNAIVYYTSVRNTHGEITDFTFTFMNNTSLRIMKGSKEDYIGMTFLSLFPHEKENGLFNDFVKTAETGIPSEATYYSVFGDYKGWFRNSIEKAGDGIVVYFRDVTESKELELNLKKRTFDFQESLNLISNIIESIKDPFIVIDKDFRIVYANAAMQYWFEKNTNYKGESLWELLPAMGNTRMKNILKENMEKQSYKSFTTKGLAPGRNYHLSVYPYQGGLTIYAQDISDKLRTEEQLKNSLKEKEILLKEVHHRVKNNLQLIASMMNLQCNVVKDPVYSELLNESRNRISTMALIHKRLYEETNYASINFRGFAEELIRSLFGIYKEASSRINLKYSFDDINIGLDYSINIGLILNELLTNTLKYAFPKGCSGNLEIEVKKCNDEITIKVKDDGIGLPEHLDFRNTESLGLLIVNSLVDQLDGTINLDSTKGTCFTITIKKEKRRQLELIK
jgi:two-component sensor histidine kinase/PAS domain-containing protein